MSQSLAQILIHLTFSTKSRVHVLRDEIREEFHAYTIGIFRAYDSPSLITNSVEDHVHSLFSISKRHALVEIIEEVKKGSSKWLKTKGQSYLLHFSWQIGYSAYSVSAGDVDSVIQYIANQREHHRTVTFQDELRTLLRQAGIEYDERYLWD